MIVISSLSTLLLVIAISLQPAATSDAAALPIVAASSYTDEVAEQKPIVEAVKAAIDRSDYRALNRLETEFRLTRSRTSSGIWKLSLFHWRILTELGPKGDGGGCDDRATDFFQGWLAATPGEAALHISRAAVLEAYAWCIRGGGYAGSVSREALDSFQAKVAEARGILTAHPTASIDPHYYAVMERIYIDQGAEKSDFKRLLDDATSREPNYHYLYFNAYRYFQPQWYGSDAEVDELARYAAARTTKAEGLGMYARYYWFAIDCHCDINQSIDWPTMKRAMRDVMARYPADWNAANFARIACQMNDPNEAAAWLRNVKGDPGKAWGDRDEMRRCLRMAQASPASAERSS
ncbi:MAG: hypothetical protein ACJ8EG_04935, partial [Sphingomicrobium sp.]